MSVADRLGYVVRRPSLAQRAMRAVAMTRAGAFVLSRSVPAVDRLLLRLSRGRVTLAALCTGIPVVELVTTGARSGARRRSVLLGVPWRDAVAVIGTQFGQPGTPDWYYNLRACPDALVEHRGRSVAVRAREAEGDEWQGIWDEARQIYAGYDAYARRIHDRPIHIMVLAEA